MQLRFIVVALVAVGATTRIAAACDDSGSATPMISPGILIGAAGGDRSHGDFILGAELSSSRPTPCA